MEGEGRGVSAGPAIGYIEIARAVCWRFADSVSMEVFSFVFFLALGRLLAPDAFGIISIAGTFIQACQILLGAGFGMAVQQKADLEAEHLTAALWANFALGVISAGVVIALAWPLSVVQGKPELLIVTISLSPVLIVASISWIYLALLRRLLRYNVTVLSAVVSIVTGGVVGVWLAYRGAGVWSLVGQQVSGAIAALTVLVLSTHWRPGIIVSWRHLFELMSFAGKTSLGGVLDFLSRRIDAPILGFFLSAYTVGVYFVAARLTATVITVSLYVAYDIVIAVLPRFPARTPAFREAAYRALQLTMLVSLPLFIFVALLAKGMILLLFGPAWSGSAQPLQVMCLSGVFYAFTLIGRQILNAAGFAGLSLIITAANAALYVVAILLIASSGPVAAAAAGGISSALFVPWVVLGMRRKLGLQPRRILSDQLPIWGATLAMAACISLANQQLSAVTSSITVGLVVDVAVGFSAFATTLRLLAPDVFRVLIGWANLSVLRKARP